MFLRFCFFFFLGCVERGVRGGKKKRGRVSRGRGETGEAFLEVESFSFRRWRWNRSGVRAMPRRRAFPLSSHPNSAPHQSAVSSMKVSATNALERARMRRCFPFPPFRRRASRRRCCCCRRRRRLVACRFFFFRPSQFLPTFCVVYLDGVPPSARASVHSSVTMQRMPGIIIGWKREKEEGEFERIRKQRKFAVASSC